MRRKRVPAPFVIVIVPAVVVAAVAAILLARRATAPMAPAVPVPVNWTLLSRESRALIEERVRRCRESPRDPEALASLGMAYQGNFLPTLAAASYERALEAGSTSARVPYFLGLARAEFGDARAAADAFRLSIGRDPAYAPARLQLGLALLDSDDVPAALESLKEARRLDPESVAVDVAIARALMRTATGSRPAAAGEAAERLRAALDREPENPAAHQLLGLLLRTLGREDEARRHLVRIRTVRAEVVRDPWYQEVQALGATPEARLVRAHFLLQAGKGVEALSLLQALARAEPDRADVQSALGGALVAGGAFEPAKAAYARAIALDASDGDSRTALASLLLDAGDLEGAAREARTALAIDGVSAQARTILAIASLRSGRASEAAEALAAVVLEHPDLVIAQASLGDAWVALGRREDAIRPYSAATKLYDAWAYAHKRLGLLYLDLGRASDAERELARAFECDRNDKETADALSRARRAAGRDPGATSR